MIRHLFLSITFAWLVAAGCASPANNQTGTAGTTGSGGTGGSGGSAQPPPPGLGQGGPFTFPQNKTSGSCTITSVGSAHVATNAAYTSWKGSFVTSNGAGGGLRVQSPQHSGGTVSEGIGYGMIAAVYMNDRPTFDGLWTYAKLHFDAKGLMNWKINSDGSTASDGAGSALDADEDIAWALLMASDQWSSVDYLNDARAVIDAIYGTAIAGDGTLKPDQYDMSVFFPPETTTTERPDWLRLGGMRVAYGVGGELCNSHFPCLVEARYASEGPDAIPADRVVLNVIDPNAPTQNRFLTGHGSASDRLYLRPEKYRFSALDKNGRTVFARDIDVAAESAAKP